VPHLRTAVCPSGLGTRLQSELRGFDSRHGLKRLHQAKRQGGIPKGVPPCRFSGSVFVSVGLEDTSVPDRRTMLGVWGDRHRALGPAARRQVGDRARSRPLRSRHGWGIRRRGADPAVQVVPDTGPAAGAVASTAFLQPRAPREVPRPVGRRPISGLAVAGQAVRCSSALMHMPPCRRCRTGAGCSSRHRAASGGEQTLAYGKGGPPRGGPPFRMAHVRRTGSMGQAYGLNAIPDGIE
jgi:hypothetical protein